jgi:hypothetical protein
VAIIKNKVGRENREFWAFVESTSDRVDNWPPWLLAAATIVSVGRLVVKWIGFRVGFSEQERVAVQ